MSNREKRRAVFDYYRFYADFLICLETHSEKDIEAIWRNEWGGEVLYSHGTSGARGVAVFYTKKYKNKVKNILTSDDGRFIVLDIHEDEYIFTLCALYAPNNDTPSFFYKIAEILSTRQEHKVVVGDFNLTLNVQLDRNDTYCNNNKSLEVLENIMDEFCLRDVWRVQNGDKREYTWTKPGNINKASRLDYALVSAGLDQKVELISI